MKLGTRMGLALVIAALSSAAVWADTASGADKTPSQEKPKVNLELRDVPVTEAIEKLFAGAGLKYELKPGISGRIVEMKLKDIGFDEALAAIAKAANLKYEVSENVYVISSAKPSAGSAEPGDAANAGVEDASTAGLTDETAEVSDQTEPSLPVLPESALGVGDAPVYYGQPDTWPYPSVGYYPYPPPFAMQYGNVTLLDRYPPLLMGPFRRVITPGARYRRIPGWAAPEAQPPVQNE